MSPDETRIQRLAYRWCGLAVLAGIVFELVEVYAASGITGLRELGQLALVSLALVGKFVIFSGLSGETPSPWALALMVWLIDLAFAFLILSGLEGLERAPGLGAWLRRMRGRALEVLTEYPGLERMAFFGVLLFVLLPLAATGAITGAFAARILGLSRIGGVLAIAVGSAGTASVFALLAVMLGERAETLARSPVLVGAGVLVLVVGGRAAYLRVLGKLKE